MKSVYNFVVTPKGNRYNNTKKIGDKELIINTEVYNHKYIMMHYYFITHVNG